ncbi:unnamed protein product [Adineta ricciae]|uniref:Uncharacterized protein n=1 Tax=Adineta ricciae TaxID=249248 RepID=A0A815BIF5_ADIRI|nr:unnamed protein product [Adineta ricciae]CAF1271975.1 unnamed protein product [Adineta ricciae]
MASSSSSTSTTTTTTTTTTTASVVTAEPGPQLNRISRPGDGSSQKNTFVNESDIITIEAKRDDPSQVFRNIRSYDYECVARGCSTVFSNRAQLQSNLFGDRHRESTSFVGPAVSFARPFDEFLSGPGNSDEHNASDTKQGGNSKS